MRTAVNQYRDATEEEVTRLKQIAVREHARLGIEDPSELTIQIRVRSLAKQKGLRIPGLPQAEEGSPKGRVKKSPDYLQASIEQKAQQCAKDRREKKLRKHIRIVRENTDRFYLFCFLKGGFARALRKSRALEVFAAIIEQAGGDIESWVSIATLAHRLGRTDKTVSTALRVLRGKRIISLIDASTVDISLNGKPIRKKQGYVIRLHPPMFWDWDSIGGVPKEMVKYLADYEGEPVDNSETPVTVTGVPR